MTPLIAAALLLTTHAAPADLGCGGVWTITAYAAEDFPGVVADGSTTTWNALARGEAIVASVSLSTGTKVVIDDLGVATVRDTGYLAPCQLDYLMATHWEAMQWGRQTRTVRVLPPGEGS
jgi:3D (Asp-Asp-Asp) domain-containing protein